MVEHLLNWLTAFIRASGYIGVFFLMAAESACIPIPSVFIMPFAGMLAGNGPGHEFNLWAVSIDGALGNLFGSIVAYWVGVRGGRPFVDRYGKYFFMSTRDIAAGDRYFQKYGDMTALISRLLPIIRTFISLPAGIARMNFPRFCVYTFIGALPFCYALAWAGLKLGDHWERVQGFVHKAEIPIMVALVVLFGLWVYRHFQPEKETAEQAAR